MEAAGQHQERQGQQGGRAGLGDRGEAVPDPAAVPVGAHDALDVGAAP